MTDRRSRGEVSELLARTVEVQSGGTQLELRWRVTAVAPPPHRDRSAPPMCSWRRRRFSPVPNVDREVLDQGAETRESP